MGPHPGARALPANYPPTPADLARTIKELIEVRSWAEGDGPGTIVPLGGMLVVNQTPEVHKSIRAFLEEVRAAGDALRTVTIRARWLLLDSKQIDPLLRGRSEGKTVGIDRAALDDLTGKVKGYRGEITCFDGQTVHIISGRSRSMVVGAIPVVGGPEAVGYSPVIANPQTGALLQVTPQLMPESKAVVLDLQSFVTRSDEPADVFEFMGPGRPSGGKTEGSPKQPASSSPPTLTLDRVNLVVQQLATTLRVTLGQPTLVGGLTLESGAGDKEPGSAPQLYLFVEVTAQ
jgi:hypothetical protein